MLKKRIRDAQAELATAVLPVGRLLFVGSAAIYWAFALVYLVAPPTEPRLPIAAIFAVLGSFFAVVAWALPAIAPRLIEPLVLASVLIAEAGAIAFVPLTGDPKQSTVVIIVMVATGAIAPTLRSAIAAALGGILGWLTIATAFPRPDLVHWLINVGAAGVVTVAIAAVRLRSVRDLLITRFMVDNATDAIYLLTRDGRLHYVNEAACALLGYPRAELLQRSVQDLDPEIDGAARETVWQDVARRRSLVAKSTVPAHDGRRVPVEMSLNLATFAGREYQCAIVRDVTAQHAAAATLERARYAAEAASRAKTEFLATMSHEIRTPLNGVFGLTELALEAEDDDERRSFLNGARASAETLLSLLNDILDYAQLDVGRLRIENVEFDARELARRVVAGLAPEARRRGLELRLSCAPGLPEQMHGDPRRLRQILANLGMNALKFTDEGEVEICLESEEDADGTLYLRASVRDTGIGIAAEDIERVFEPFTQITGSHARRHGGAGLGLSIARDLAHAMGGTLDVTSAAGSGSTFSCRVPSSPARVPEERAPRPAESNAVG